MGEYIPAAIQFGGKISRAVAEELIDEIASFGLRSDESEADPSLENLGDRFYGAEINYGNLEELRDFAHEHGLSYVQWYDSGYDWPEGGYAYDGKEVIDFAGPVDDPMLSLSDLNKFTSLDAAKQHLRRIKNGPGKLEIA